MNALSAAMVGDRWVAENFVESLHTALTISSGYVLYLWLPILYEAWIKKERDTWFYTLLAFMIIKFSTFYNYAPLTMFYWAETEHGFLPDPISIFLSTTRSGMHLMASAILIARAWHLYDNHGMWWYFWRWCIGVAGLVAFLTIFGVPPWDPPNVWNHPVMPWQHFE
jgi:hypothetical protein